MKICRSITIDAPPELVWQVTVDVRRWPEWSPNFQRVHMGDGGGFALGSTALIKQRGLPALRWRVTSLRGGQEFAWRTRFRGTDMLATHRIEPAVGGTRNEMELVLSGGLARLLWPLLRRALASALDVENASLRDECMRLAAGGADSR